MTQLPEPTRSTADLLQQRTHSAWMVMTPPEVTWPTAPRSQADTAECTCPIDCIRDHEQD